MSTSEMTVYVDGYSVARRYWSTPWFASQHMPATTLVDRITRIVNEHSLRMGLPLPLIRWAFDTKDSAGQYWRHAVYPHYKKRAINPTNEEFQSFLRFSQDLNSLTADAGTRLDTYPGVEADDLIALHIHQRHGQDAGSSSAIISWDKDLDQIAVAYPGVQLWTTDAGLIVPRTTRTPVEEKILRGCGSDNIPNAATVDAWGENPLQRSCRQHRLPPGLPTHGIEQDIRIAYRSNWSPNFPVTAWTSKGIPMEHIRRNAMLCDLWIAVQEVSKFFNISTI